MSGDSPRRFYLDRQEDATGISGTGKVAEGVEFSDGSCAVRWLTRVRSIVFYNSIADVDYIHGHNGATKITWQDTSKDED
jgi:hypothetical protein